MALIDARDRWPEAKSLEDLIDERIAEREREQFHAEYEYVRGGNPEHPGGGGYRKRGDDGIHPLAAIFWLIMALALIGYVVSRVAPSDDTPACETAGYTCPWDNESSDYYP